MRQLGAVHAWGGVPALVGQPYELGGVAVAGAVAVAAAGREAAAEARANRLRRGRRSLAVERDRRGADAVAIDPLYGCTLQALTAHVQIDYQRVVKQMRAKPELFRFRSFASIDEAEASRRLAAERFLTEPVHAR